MKKFILSHLYWRHPKIFSQLSNRGRDWLPAKISTLNELNSFFKQIKMTAQHPQDNPLQGHEFARKCWDDAKRIKEFCHKKNIHLTFQGDWDFPKPLDIPLLTYFGQPIWTTKSCLAVVGSRRPSAEALSWMEVHLPQSLKAFDLAVVSGGARGIDQKAHSICMRASQPTICFLPSGFENIYPKELSHWVSDIANSGGAVVSQFHPMEVLHKGHFHQRNRLIAALCPALLVMEAGRRSGSLLTAKWALEFHREIAVLPHSPMNEGALGGLDLIYDGAQWLRDSEDLKNFLASAFSGCCNEFINEAFIDLSSGGLP